MKTTAIFLTLLCASISMLQAKQEEQPNIMCQGGEE